MSSNFSQEFDQILRTFINLKKQGDKPFVCKKTDIPYINESLFDLIDTNGEEGLQIDEIEAFFNSFKFEKGEEKKYYDNRYRKFADNYGIKYETNATNISFAYDNMKHYVEMEVRKSKYPNNSDLSYNNSGFVYTSQYNNDVESYLSYRKKNNSSQKITYFELINTLADQSLADYISRFSRNYKNLKFPATSDLEKLFNKLNKNGNNELDVSELNEFFLNLKGGDTNNVNFKIDNEVIKKFKELTGITDSDNIPDGAIVVMFDLIERIIFERVSNQLSPDSNTYIGSDFDSNIEKLTSDVSFDTKDEKFSRILSSFDIGTSDNPSSANDKKLSSGEVRNLWEKIKTECASVADGIIKLDKSKVEAYIKKNFSNSNITFDDFISFINVIDLALKNSYVNPNQKIDYSKSGITEPNAEIDGLFNQYGFGDCWFISTLVAIDNTDKGKDMLNSCLRKDNNGNVYVYLRGPKETYVITAQELADSKLYSQGDGDARAIEIAVNKYFEKRNNVSTLTGGKSNIAYWLVTGLNYRDNLGEYYSVTEPVRDAKGEIVYEYEVDNETKKPKVDEEGNIIYKSDNNGNKIARQNKFYKNYKNEDLDKIDFSKHAVTAASNKGTRETAVGFKEDGTKVEFPQNHSIAVVGVDSEYVYIIDQNDINPKTGDINSAKIKFTREVFNNFFTRVSVFSTDKSQQFSYTPNKENHSTTTQKFQTEHTPENEALFRKFAGEHLEYYDSDRLKSYKYNFSESDLKILDKFPIDCKSFGYARRGVITRAEIKWFFQQLKCGKTDSSEINFDDKTYKRVRKKLGIKDADNISNEDILHLYNTILSLMELIVSTRK